MTNKEYDTLKITFNAINLKYKYLHRQIGIANDSFKIALTIKDKELAQKKVTNLIDQLKPEKDETRQAVISFVLTHPNSYLSPYFFYS